MPVPKVSVLKRVDCIKWLYLTRFDPRLNSSEAENKFVWTSVTPYISFFIVLLATVAVFPLCDKLWIPCSELSLVALFFTGKCLPSLMIFCVVDVSQVRTGSYPPAGAREILPIMVDKKRLCHKGVPFLGFRYITAAWLAQLGDRRSAEREVAGSNPGRTNT